MGNLVIARTVGTRFHLYYPGGTITIKVTKAEQNQAQLRIEAPDTVRVERDDMVTGRKGPHRV